MKRTLDATNARQGEKSGHVRNILIVSTGLACVALVAAWAVFS